LPWPCPPWPTFGEGLIVERTLALDALEALLVIVAVLSGHLLSFKHLDENTSLKELLRPRLRVFSTKL
jgi:hypothetical protein